MGDPKRLKDSFARGELERTLLEGALDIGPTSDQCETLWVALASRAAPVVEDGPSKGGRSSPAGDGGGPPGPGASAGVSGLSGVIAGLALLAAAGASAGAVGYLHWKGTPHAAPDGLAPTQAEAVSAPVEVATAMTAPPASTPAPLVSIAGAPSAKAAPPFRSGAAVRPVESPLRAETGLVSRARAAIRSGDCASALRALTEARTRFPNGPIAQERDALTVLALHCAGSEDQAAARANDFLRQYPTSPHTALVHRFARASP